MMAADAILGRTNPWTELFDPGRKAIGPRPLGLRQGEHGLPVYPDPRPVRRPEGRSLRARPKRGQGGRSSSTTGPRSPPTATRDGTAHDPLGDLHAHGLRGGVEPGGADVGLPVPRLAVQANGDVISGPGGVAAAARGLTNVGGTIPHPTRRNPPQPGRTGRHRTPVRPEPPIEVRTHTTRPPSPTARTRDRSRTWIRRVRPSHKPTNARPRTSNAPAPRHGRKAMHRPLSITAELVSATEATGDLRLSPAASENR